MTDPLWTSAEIESAAKGTATAGFEAFGVAIDSRDVRSGDLFVALQGEKQDGHAFLSAAFKNGAAGAIVASTDPLPSGFPAIVVEDTFLALNDLGKASRDRLNARVIGVTGSVGKTGTKNALRAALQPSGVTYASERSFNNHVGVPLTLARTPKNTAFAVLEMGMNHEGELRALAALARPDIAIITTVEAVHMAYFDGVEQIADAKAEILERSSPGGTAILNRDNPQFGRLQTHAQNANVARILSFGKHPESDVRLVKNHLHDDCSVVVADVDGVLVTYKIGVPGAHWVKNSLAVMAAVSAADGDLGLAGLALADMRAPKGRGRRHLVPFRDGEILVIDESYNASPVAVRAAVAELGRVQPPKKRGRKIVVLGDMLELGETSASLHAELSQTFVDAGVNVVVGVGSLVNALLVALPEAIATRHVENAASAADEIFDLASPGDVVMIKGSNAIGLSRVVDALILGRDNSASTVAAAR
ncbi:MAG: UDP-N-acetylmuramoyl-tripeptide--D-alanyl-D-alanine ligase [Proteobacteria bacterium]|nr:UDP-N-acetylmuramoyl-tripeptide--D-alanyl-D-alanine ligase [Pseudomonadota bacterium]